MQETDSDGSIIEFELGKDGRDFKRMVEIGSPEARFCEPCFCMA